MNIGAAVRKLRREREITQEQLAEYLNISVSAISQWECGKTAPDISQLPMLANIFKVSADVILGIDVDRAEEKIQEICDAAYNEAVAGYRTKSVNILRDGLKEFPSSYKLMARLVGSENEEIGLSEAEKEARFNESVALCQKILDGCTDEKIRRSILPYLCMELYPKTGRREEAINLAKSEPIYQETSNEWLANIYEGDELIEQLKVNVMALNCTLVGNMLDIVGSRAKHDDGTPLYNDDEKLLICKKIITLMKTMFEDGEYYYHSQCLDLTHTKMMNIYAEREDAENTLAQLENAAKYTVIFDTYDQTAEYSSLMFKGMESGGYFKDSPNDGRSSQLLKIILANRYDFIRDDPRFIAIESRLKLVNW